MNIDFDFLNNAYESLYENESETINKLCCDYESNIYFNTLHNYYYCNECGNVLRYTNVFENKKKQQLFYKRFNYLSKLISEINGLIPIDDDLIICNKAIELVIKFINKNQINYMTVRNILKKNKLFNCYKYINYICDIINNVQKCYIDNNLKKIIINEFLKFEKLYKNKKILIRTKKILSYQFILYRIFLKLNIPHLILRLNHPLLTRNQYNNELYNKYFSEFDNL